MLCQLLSAILLVTVNCYRFISYVFHRQRFALEFKDVMLEQMTADYIDTFAKYATQNLTKCFQELGELGCFYTVADEERMVGVAEC